MTDTRNVFALILAVMILQIAGGLLSMLTPLGLEALGTAPQFIGGIAALYATGFMLGAWTAPAALASFGNIRLFAAAAAVTSAGSIALSLWYEPGFWAIVRIVQGVSFAYMFTSVESWLGQAVPDKSRGNVMGLYHMGAKLSLMIGPFFVAGLGARADLPHTAGTAGSAGSQGNADWAPVQTGSGGCHRGDAGGRDQYRYARFAADLF